MSEPNPPEHPLARFADFDGTAKAPRWVIPGFIGHGVVVISGAQGVGKTTALLPLAMTAAGLQGDPQLMPSQWRHTVYITEDIEQVRRILAGLVGHGHPAINPQLVQERLHLVEAVRLDPSYVASVGKTYRDKFTRVVGGVEMLPLVVLDTKSAVLALENENDNSEASRMMAALKQGFDGLPVWLIGHVAKPNMGRSDVSGLSSRGASAIEGDANQTIFLIREGESRYLVQGKTRFDPRWPELEITSYTVEISANEEFGMPEPVTLRWGIATPATESRKEAAKQAADIGRQMEALVLSQEIRDAVGAAWLANNPVNREGLKRMVKRNAANVLSTLESLLAESWLVEVDIPPKERLHHSKSSFLVLLSTDERDAVLRGEDVPVAKRKIPASWRKSPRPPIPETASAA